MTIKLTKEQVQFLNYVLDDYQVNIIKQMGNYTSSISFGSPEHWFEIDKIRTKLNKGEK